MSESAPESSGGGGNVFTRKVGPLPMWAWMGILLAVALAFYLLKSKGSSTASSGASSTNNAPGGVDSSLVPQFVNQTYVNNTPPAAPAHHGDPKPKKGTPVKDDGSQEQLTRTWESEGGSTYAAVAQRLTGTATTTLTPQNEAAKNWMSKVYSKNHKAKMPKGLLFTYTEGTVTDKS